MKRNWIILGGIAAFLLVIGLSVMCANNSAARYEESIIAAHDNSRNILSQYAPKIGDAIGVTNLQASALENLFQKANESRYGDGGSKAITQFIAEQNPNLDQSNYGKIIEMIEAARNDFQDAQTIKLDRIRAYRTALRSWPGGGIMGMLGYPKPAEDDQGNEKPFFSLYGKVIMSGHADNAFKTGIDNGLGIGVPQASGNHQ